MGREEWLYDSPQLGYVKGIYKVDNRFGRKGIFISKLAEMLENR